MSKNTLNELDAFKPPSTCRRGRRLPETSAGEAYGDEALHANSHDVKYRTQYQYMIPHL